MLRYPFSFAVVAVAGLFASTGLFATLNVDVTVQTTPTPKVTANWNSQGSNTVNVRKRLLGETDYAAWSVVATYPTDGSPPFVDTDVITGNTYEYRVDSIGGGNRVANFVATIEAPLNEERGAVLLVVEDTWAAELAGELESLELDLAGDGWQVVRLDWGREAGIGDEVALKAAIQAAVVANPEINSLFLFGAVPMVKSGSLAPDGHDPHPHETDTYYADLDGTWTDTQTLQFYDQKNKEYVITNIPSDGEYDQSNYPTDIELATGRVTFHSMPAFKKTEVEYLRDYIHKEHAYRYGHRAVTYQNFVGDELYLYGTNTTLKPMVGTGNWTSTGSLDTIIGDETYLFAFGARTTSWDAARDTFQKGIFTACFRSHIQEFWASNNNMRGMLAQPDWGLTACWGNRPAWYMQKMAAGYPIGDSVRDTQNDVRRSISQRNYSNYSEEYAGPFVSNNLMGDPTLRIAHVQPVSNLTIARTDASNIQLNWTASPATDLIGYHVYASNERLGPYTRLTTSPITDTFYAAAAASDVDTWFQVRAVATVTVPTGVYDDQSHGQFALAKDDGSVNTPPTASDLTVTGKMNTPLIFQFPGADADGDSLTPILLDNPDNGQIRWSNGQPFYVSKRDEAGTDTATFVMFDGVTVSEPATVTFTTNDIGDTLVAWEFPDGAKAALAPTFVSPFVQSSSIDYGPGTGPISSWPGTDALTSRFIGSTFSATADYFFWTLTPEADVAMNIQRMNFGICGNAGTNIYFELRASTDNFATFTTIPCDKSVVVGQGYSGNTGTLVSADTSGIALLQTQGQPVTFRLHFWQDGSSSISVGLGKITDPVYYDAIEDVSILGTVTSLSGAPFVQASTTDILVPENDTASIEVTLSAPPVSPVTLTIAKESGDADLTLSSSATLNFDSTNWDVPQTVTFAAASDADSVDGTAIFNITATGLDTVVLNLTEFDAARPPVAVADTYEVNLDQTLNVAAPGVLSNDSDGNGDSITAVLVDDVSEGTLTLNSDGSFSYVPEPGFEGVTTFTYYATDGGLQSATTTVTLAVYSTTLKVSLFGAISSYTPAEFDPSQADNATTKILGGTNLEITGNGWIKLDLTSIDITADTVISFDFNCASEAEIHAIGFDTDTTISPENMVQIWGSQAWANENLDDYGPSSPNVKHYEIAIGQIITGTFRYLVFAQDDDTNRSSVSNYANVRVYVPTAATTWADAIGLNIFTNSGLSDDANGDGKPNFYHFAFATNPLGPGGSTEGKLVNAISEESSSNYFTITAPFRLGAVFSGNPLTSAPVDGIVYTIFGDSDLVAPLGDVTVEELTPALSSGLPALDDLDAVAGPDWEYRTFRLTTPLVNDAPGFFWIGVTEAP